MRARLAEATGENVVDNADFAIDARGHEVAQAIGIVEHGFDGRIGIGEALVATPAQFDAGKEIGLGPCHPEQASGREMRQVAENLRIGVETRGCAAPIVHPAQMLDLALGLAAREAQAMQLLLARHLHHHVVRQRIDHGHTDAM
ncbi:hypothetical protein D9M68_913500 [compost metagenome]